MLESLLNDPRFALALIVALIATITDFHKRKIYDYLTYPAIIVGVSLNIYLSLPLENYLTLVEIFALPALAFAVGYGLNYKGWWGGGDVKLVTAIVAFLPAYAFQFILFPFFFLIPVSLIQAGLKGGRKDFADRKVHLPSAPFFLGAVILSLFTSILVVG